MWVQPRLDKHQFVRRRMAVRQDTGIAFSDYARMGTFTQEIQHERRLETPAWANSDKELREVVLKLCERRFYLRPNPDLTLEQRRERIRKAELAQAEKYRTMLPGLVKKEIQFTNLDTQIVTARRGTVA